jgi:LCP family protein required for cell wall assembly
VDVPDPRDVAPPPAPLQDGDKPYTKYRARPTLLGRGRGRDDGALLRPPGGPGPGPAPAPGRGRRLPGLGRVGPGRIVKWLLLALVGWLALSLVVFLVSATIHQDDVGGGLDPGGFPLTSPTNVLVLGSDRRTAKTSEPGSGGPSRADSIMLMRVGGGASSRLSIPRDTVVEIPGRGRNKINAAYAFGGAQLAVETVRSYLGLEVNHVVDVNFENFPDLVDAMGGIDYTGACVVSRINGGFRNGGYTLRLKSGTTRLDGDQALALARTRKNDCRPNESDLTRARRQQKLFAGMKDRLTSPGAFARLPLISWEAPKALRSDMSGPTLLGLFGAFATSGTPPSTILRPDGAVRLPDGGAGLTVSDAARQRAVERFLRD